MLHLLNLPRDLLVHLLLHHFTAQEVIQFRCLCTELYHLVHYCLGRRRTLKLFFSFAEVKAYTQELYEHNLESDQALRLHPPGPSSDELILDQHTFLNPVVDLLVDRLFPHVTHLIVYFGHDIFHKKSHADNIRFPYLIKDNVRYLFERIRTRLTGLSLFGSNRGDEVGQQSSGLLLHEINQMHNLKRLDICVHNLYLRVIDEDHNDHDDALVLEEQTFMMLEPKMLNKLERISVLFGHERNGPQFCEHSFGHLGPSLTQLAFHQLDAHKPWTYVPEAQLNGPLIDRTSSQVITHLKLTQQLSTILPKVLPQFPRLKSLDLVNFTFSNTERPMSLLELFPLLKRCCPELTDLRLSRFTLGWVRKPENLLQLKHITKLALKCVRQWGFPYHVEVKPEDENIPFCKLLRSFGHIFPNLEQFNLKTEPGYFVFRDDDDSIMTESIIRLRLLSIGKYSGVKFTCHHLLSAQYRKRYIRECGEKWAELKKKLESYVNFIVYEKRCFRRRAILEKTLGYFGFPSITITS